MAKRLKHRAYASIVICLLLVGMLSSIGLSNIPLVKASPGAVIYAGCRESTYGISPFPSPQEWEHDIKTMASYWSGSQPVGVWIVGILAGEGSDYTQWTECNLQFPSPGGSYEHVIFDNTDFHESYLDYFDTHGIKVWLQVEPGLADLPTLIDLVLNRYGSHSCVIGFGVDVEWHKNSQQQWGVPVTDAQAENWEARVKSHNSNYTLFLKHFAWSWMPPTYRGNIIFVDDSQGFGSLNAMVSEFDDWAANCPYNIVFFQYGYEADKVWWQNLDNPPKDIGDAIKAVVEQDMGMIWVDFTLRDVFPTDTTPPAAPTGLTATAVSSSQINLDWNNNTENDLDHYHVYRSTTSGFTPGAGNFVADATVSNYSDTGLNASTTYYYKVTAVDTSSNESTPSAQASATTQAAPTPGWDFQCHTYTHPFLTELTAAQIRAELEQVNSDFQANLGYTPEHHAYPYGYYNATVKSVVAEYRLTGRCAWEVTGAINNYPMADWYQMNAVEIQASTAVSTITGYIDQAISNKALLNIFTHKVIDPAPQYGCTPTTLRAVCDYLLNKQNAGQLQVLPMRDAYTSWNGTKAVVVLGFDDGNKTDYTTTWGILTNEYGFIGTSYIFTQAIDEGWSDYMSWAQVQEMAGPADTTPPAAPTGLTATAVSSSQINLDWNNNTENDLNHYHVYRSTTSGFTPGPGNFVADTTVSNYSDTGLNASTTYYYKVTAIDTSGNESTPSAQASATTQSAPTKIEAESGTRLGSAQIYSDSAASGGQAVGWIDSAGDGIQFTNFPAASQLTIRYATINNGTLSLYVNNTHTTNVSFTSTGAWSGTYADKVVSVSIPAGATVKFQFDSGDVAVNLDYIEPSGAPDTTPPAAPTGLTASAVSSSQIDLDWANNTETDLASYKVYRSTTSGFTPGPGNFVASTTVSNYSDTGLSASTTYYYKVTAVDTSNNESDPSAEASATTQAGAAPSVTHAGLRASTYGAPSPFPSAEEWESDIKTMASYWSGSQPTGVWNVGVIWDPNDCHLEFPGTSTDPNILFSDTDFHEPYLDYFDTHGIDVWLQVEPGDAEVGTLIDLVLNQYGHHSCVKGFGVDVEWYKNSQQQWGVPVTDAKAQAWENRVKSHNSNYTLFLKHFWLDWMPPNYRGDIIFNDDYQMFDNLSDMVAEFADNWAPFFYPNPVWFQVGYEADKVWWQNLDNPPKDIGDALDAAISNDMGIFWVDFTMSEVFPPPDTTPPAAPTGLTATAVSTSQINLDWNNNTEGDLDHYNVYRSTTSGFTPGAGNFVAQTTSSSYSDTGLSASTTYYYKVTAVDTSNNESSPSAQASATTQAPPPTMTAYYCDVDTMSSALPMTVGGNLNSKTEATSAQYTAIGSSDNSRWTTPNPGYADEVFLWLEMYIDEAVENIDKIELHFEGYLLNESANFSIWVRDVVNSEWDQIGTTESIATGADGTITRTITANIANYIAADGKIIWGVYESEDSQSLKIDYVRMVYYLKGPPDTTPPAAPTGLTATAVSSSQINLDWNNNAENDLDHYHVYRSTTSGFTPGAGNFVTDTTVSNYSDTGLSASTTYYYKVTAVDTSGNESTPSAQASATTQSAPTRIEAESGTRLGSAQIYSDSTASGGQAVGWIDSAGDGVQFTNFPAASQLTIWYTTINNGTLSLYVNNTHTTNVSFTSTGDWFGPYADKVVSVSIPAGATVKLQFDSGDVAVNLDYIEPYA